MTRDEFIARNPIDAVMESRGIQLIGGGNARKAKCPFHNDRKPSITVDVKLGLWKCWAGCGAGSVIDLLMKLDNVSFKEFAERNDISKEEKPRRTFGRFVNPFARRKEKLEPVAKPAPDKDEPDERKVVATYSYQNQFGKELFQTIRYEPKDFRQRHKEGDKWVWNLNGVERVLFGLPEVMKSQVVFLHEGEADCLATRALGFVSTTSPMGAKSWLDAYAESLIGKDVAICGDNDEPGRAYVEAVFDSLAGKAASVRIIELPKDVKDVSDFIATFKNQDDARKAIQNLYDSAHPFIKGHKILVKSVAEMQINYRKQIATLSDCSFSLGKWMPCLSDIRPITAGEMVLIIGSTGSGKTAVASDIAFAAMPLPTVFFELELPESLLFERFVSNRYKIKGEEVIKTFENGFDLTEVDCKKYFSNLYTCCRSGLTVDQIEEQIVSSELKMGVSPKMVVLDYVQLIRSDKRSGSRYERTSDVAEELRQIANRRNVILVITSQPHRPKDDEKEIGLFSAKDSGALESSANLVIGIWRDPKEEILLHGKILKGTKGGAGRRWQMNFDGARMLVTERRRRMDDEVERPGED